MDIIDKFKMDVIQKKRKPTKKEQKAIAKMNHKLNAEKWKKKGKKNGND